MCNAYENEIFLDREANYSLRFNSVVNDTSLQPLYVIYILIGSPCINEVFISYLRIFHKIAGFQQRAFFADNSSSSNISLKFQINKIYYDVIMWCEQIWMKNIEVFRFELANRTAYSVSIKHI